VGRGNKGSVRRVRRGLATTLGGPLLRHKTGKQSTDVLLPTGKDTEGRGVAHEDRETLTDRRRTRKLNHGDRAPMLDPCLSSNPSQDEQARFQPVCKKNFDLVTCPEEKLKKEKKASKRRRWRQGVEDIRIRTV